jgi:hypothetical protein
MDRELTDRVRTMADLTPEQMDALADAILSDAIFESMLYRPFMQPKPKEMN